MEFGENVFLWVKRMKTLKRACSQLVGEAVWTTDRGEVSPQGAHDLIVKDGCVSLWLKIRAI